jgi:hypothetical protein
LIHSYIFTIVFSHIYRSPILHRRSASIYLVSTLTVPRGIDDLRTTCKEALEAYSPQNEMARVRSKSVNHPFAFPKKSIIDDGLTLDPVAVRTELTWLPATADISNPRLAPISAVERQLRNRYHTLAENWVGVTNPPPNEKLAGTVILVDVASRYMAPAILADYIPQEVSSISILASPLCVTAPLVARFEGGPATCLEYVDELLNYFTSNYPGLATSGPDGTAGVTSKLVPSTAAGLARPMTANTLLCPPGTLDCLPAALGKVPQPYPTDPPIPLPPFPSTILFDVPESIAAASFVDKVGRCGLNPLAPEACIKVIQLATSETAPTVPPGGFPSPSPGPLSNSGEETDSTFTDVTNPTDDSGLDTTSPSYTGTQELSDPTVLQNTTAYETFQSSTEDMPTVVQDAAVTDDGGDSPVTETNDGTTTKPDSEYVFSSEEIDAAMSNNTDNTQNTGVSAAELNGESAESAIGEQVSEEGEKLDTSYLDTVTYNDLIAERMLSQARIAEANYVSSDPMVFCPTETTTGNLLSVEGGYTMSDDGTYVVVSDTNDIVTFLSPVTVTTLVPQVGEFVNPDTGETYIDEYITIWDAILQDFVNVTDTVVSSDGGNVQVDRSIGNLYVDPSTSQVVNTADGAIEVFQGTMLLDGAAAVLSNPDDTHTLITGQVVGVGVSSVKLTPQGTTTINSDGGLEVSGQSDPDGFTQTTDPSTTPYAPEQVYQMPPYSDDQPNPADPFVARQLVEYDNCLTDYSENNAAGRRWNPFVIKSHGSGTVTFDVHQIYKASSISWVAVDYVGPSGAETCTKGEELVPNSNEVMSGFVAKCDANGQAIVWVHIHDGSRYIGQQGIPKCKGSTSNCTPDHTDKIPGRCEPSQDIYANNKCHFRYAIDCSALPTTMARRRLQSIGGPVPPPIVTPAAAERGRVLVQNEEGPLFGNVFQECIHRRTKRADGKVIYNNFKFGNGIQNAGLPVEDADAGGNQRGLLGKLLRGRTRRNDLEVINV